MTPCVDNINKSLFLSSIMNIACTKTQSSYDNVRNRGYISIWEELLLDIFLWCLNHYMINHWYVSEKTTNHHQSSEAAVHFGNHVPLVPWAPAFPEKMKTWSNENIFRITDSLLGESTGHRWTPLTKASDTELWCFLWSALEQTTEPSIETPVFWDAFAFIMTSL